MASYHLTNLIQNAAVKMGTLAIYKPSPVATSGDRSTITDSTLALTVNEMTHGLAIITYDAGGAAAAPEGEYASIVSNTATAISVATNAFTTAIAAGDEVMVIRPKYPLVEWKRGVNMVLKSLGDVPVWDATTLLVAGQTEYTLPAAILEPIEVWINTNTTTGDKEWAQISDWRMQDAAPGTVKTIVIPDRYIYAGRYLGIKYYGMHPEVNAFDAHIDIPLELVSSKLAWHMINRGGITDKNRSQAEKVLAELNDADRKFKIPNKKSRSSQFLSWGRNSDVKDYSP